ncbi:hypothetical protein B0H13DRAFT_2326869 [Mycena leptocephala]|nr:hypothetical protein B0H13DRAFT_2326869 [Mycena leptocephala]
MAKGQIHKKLKTQRKTRQACQDRQYDLRSAARHVHTSAFLACEELVLYHLLEACTLASLIALSHTSVFFRTLVKTLFRIRLIAAVDPFVGHENTAKFFEVLKSTESAIAGSTIARILAPPIDDIEDWMPNNLNIYPPLGCTVPWEQFFKRIQLPIRSFQPGVTRPYGAVTRSHVEYESRSKGRAITLSESIDACVLTPATAAVTTLGMCVATCSTLAVLYPQLVNQRRALEGWNEPSIQKCIDMEERGQGVNVRLSLPVGCTEEVKDLFKKQTMLLRAVETVDSGNRPSARTEGVVITGSAVIEDLIISVKAKILRWTETGFFPNGSNLAMRVSLTRLDTFTALCGT